MCRPGACMTLLCSQGSDGGGIWGCAATNGQYHYQETDSSLVSFSDAIGYEPHIGDILGHSLKTQISRWPLDLSDLIVFAVPHGRI